VRVALRSCYESGSPAGAAVRVAPEAGEVDDVQRGDVVRLPTQVVLPEPLPPEAEPVHVLVVVAERRVAVRRALRAGHPACFQSVAHRAALAMRKAVCSMRPLRSLAAGSQSSACLPYRSAHAIVIHLLQQCHRVRTRPAWRVKLESRHRAFE